MKNLVMTLALTLISAAAHAETYCSVSRENPTQKSTFDQLVAQNVKVLDGKTEQSFIVLGNKLIETSKQPELANYLRWNGAEIIAFNKSGKNLVIGIAHIDTNDLTDMARMDAFAVGSGDTLNLISYSRKLSVFCMER